MPGATPSCFHVAIGSRFDNIELVQTVLADLLGDLTVTEEERHWIDVAVREAVANAIKHGNRQDGDKRVVVDLGIEGDDELVVRVRDEGAGFDPSGVDDPRQPENRLRPSGRGIFFMERLMDRIEYDFRPGGGTVVTLRKRLSVGDGAAAGTTADRRSEEETR